MNEYSILMTCSLSGTVFIDQEPVSALPNAKTLQGNSIYEFVTSTNPSGMFKFPAGYLLLHSQSLDVSQQSTSSIERIVLKRYTRISGTGNFSILGRFRGNYKAWLTCEREGACFEIENFPVIDNITSNQDIGLIGASFSGNSEIIVTIGDLETLSALGNWPFVRIEKTTVPIMKYREPINDAGEVRKDDLPSGEYDILLYFWVNGSQSPFLLSKEHIVLPLGESTKVYLSPDISNIFGTE